MRLALGSSGGVRAWLAGEERAGGCGLGRVGAGGQTRLWATVRREGAGWGSREIHRLRRLKDEEPGVSSTLIYFILDVGGGSTNSAFES